METLLDVVSVVAGEDYTLFLVFENGEKRRFDMKPLLDKKPFSRLKDSPLFLKATVAYGTGRMAGKHRYRTRDSLVIWGRHTQPKAEISKLSPAFPHSYCSFLLSPCPKLGCVPGSPQTELVVPDSYLSFLLQKLYRSPLEVRWHSTLNPTHF